MHSTLFMLLGLFVTCLPAAADSDDWPQFRGPGGSATSSGKQLPQEWSADKNIAWKAKLPGYGWSSPIIWGDKVFVTTAVTDKQRKPSGGFGGPGGFGGGAGPVGGPRGGAPRGFGAVPQPGQIMSPLLQERLNLTAEQKKQSEELQKGVDGKLEKLLTDEQNKQLKDMRQSGGRGGVGGFGGRAQPGQLVSPFLQARLNVTAEQKKQLEELQKEVDGKVGKLLTDAQNQQLKEVRQGGGRGGFATPTPPGQIMPTFLQERLNLTAEQKKRLEEQQKVVDGKLGKILTDEQNQQLKDARGGSGRGGFGGFAARPQPGQVLSPFLQERLNLTAEQKKQLEELQKEIDGKLAKLLTDEQNKQLKEMREGLGRGGAGSFGGRGGFGRQQPSPDTVYKWEVYCLSAADGEVIWKQTAVEGKPTIPINPSNTYATETPVTDGERVYAYFGMTGVFCFDFTGKLVWKVDLGSYRLAMGYGPGSSPVLDGGRLFIQCDNEEKSFLVALDAKTGKELWRVDRLERSGWSTPLIWKNKVRTEVVCLGSPRVRSYDPATGKQLWELGGLNGQIKASPVSSPELLYVGTGGGFGGFGEDGGPGTPSSGGRAGAAGGRFGGGRPLFAVKAGASGDITLKDGAKSNDGVAWQLPQAGPPTASPLLVDGYLYVLEERGGLLSCYNAKTGKQVYKERLPGARGFTSSPWAYDGKVFCLDDGGTTHVIQAGPQFKVLGKNTIGEMCWSSPAVAGGALFLRTVDQLYCIKQKGGQE